jgi:hypothetical protein
MKEVLIVICLSPSHSYVIQKTIVTGLKVCIKLDLVVCIKSGFFRKAEAPGV